VLSLLFRGGESSWTKLLEVTKLSKNTLSKTLQELSEEGTIKESVRRAGERGRPSVICSLRKGKGEKSVRRLLEVLSEFRHAEEMALEFTELKKEEAKRAGSKSIDRISEEYYQFVTNLAIAVFEKSLLANFGDARDALIGSEALDSARRILWDNTFLKNYAGSIRKDVGADSDEILTNCTKELEKLRKDLSRFSLLRSTKVL